MSTKINVRSPFYLNLTEPVAPTPLFQCGTADIQNLTIDQQGQISQPTTALGTVLSITSSDSDFSNDKFATVTTDTDRDITVRVSIPANYSNSADGFLDCPKIVQQPAFNTGGATPTCTGGVTASGSIPAVTIDVDGDSSSVDLSSYFTSSDPVSAYSIYIANQSLVNASVSSNTLTISSNAIAGTTNVIVSATDGGSNTCTASQTIAVTVNAASQTFICSLAGFTGGGIATDGTITKPDSVADVGTIRTTSGDTSTNITSYPANTTGTDRSVTLFFDLTVPTGYSNAGATVECEREFVQDASLPTFTCTTANLSDQRISTSGLVDYGSASLGSITGHTSSASDFSNGKFAEVSSDTPRSVTFNVTIPSSGFSNSGSTALSCPVTINQPARPNPCGSNTYKLSTAMPSPSDFCTGLFTVSKAITSAAASVTTALGKQVCQNNAPFLGGNFYYAVSINRVSVGTGTGKFFLWKIDDEGIVRDVATHICPTDGSGLGTGKGGSL